MAAQWKRPVSPINNGGHRPNQQSTSSTPKSISTTSSADSHSVVSNDPPQTPPSHGNLSIMETTSPVIVHSPNVKPSAYLKERKRKSTQPHHFHTRSSPSKPKSKPKRAQTETEAPSTLYKSVSWKQTTSNTEPLAESLINGGGTAIDSHSTDNTADTVNTINTVHSTNHQMLSKFANHSPAAIPPPPPGPPPTSPPIDSIDSTVPSTDLVHSQSTTSLHQSDQTHDASSVHSESPQITSRPPLLNSQSDTFTARSRRHKYHKIKGPTPTLKADEETLSVSSRTRPIHQSQTSPTHEMRSIFEIPSSASTQNGRSSIRSKSSNARNGRNAQNNGRLQTEKSDKIMRSHSGGPRSRKKRKPKHDSLTVLSATESTVKRSRRPRRQQSDKLYRRRERSEQLQKEGNEKQLKSEKSQKSQRKQQRPYVPSKVAKMELVDRQSHSHSQSMSRSASHDPSHPHDHFDYDAATFSSLMATEHIETYRVDFRTRVCGIELVPFDEEDNCGAMVIRCHTELSRARVVPQSLLVGINGQLVIDSDYEAILEVIGTSGRPLALTFHAPVREQSKISNLSMEPPMERENSMNSRSERQHTSNQHEARPSWIMKANDDILDGAFSAGADQFVSPQLLFGGNEVNEKWKMGGDRVASPDVGDLQNGKTPRHRMRRGKSSEQYDRSPHHWMDEEERERIQRSYTLLYHKYREQVVFQNLTNKTIHEKTEEIKRLHKENRSLKAMLSVRDSHIQTMHSSEQMRLQEVLAKYQVLNEKNAEIQQENVAQKLRIEQLEEALRHSQDHIAELQKQSLHNLPKRGSPQISRRSGAVRVHTPSRYENEPRLHTKGLGLKNQKSYSPSTPTRTPPVDPAPPVLTVRSQTGPQTEQFESLKTADDKLQDELRKRLQIQSLPSSSSSDADVRSRIKSVNGVHSHKLHSSPSQRSMERLRANLGDSNGLEDKKRSGSANSMLQRSGSSKRTKKKRHSAIGHMLKVSKKKVKAMASGHHHHRERQVATLVEIREDENGDADTNRATKQEKATTTTSTRNGRSRNHGDTAMTRVRVRSSSLESKLRERRRKETIV